MRGATRRSSLLIAAFAILLAIAAPHAARAQAATPFNINTCQQNQVQATLKHAQEQIAAFSKTFNNATVPTLNTQCFNYLLALFNMFTGDIDPTNLILKAIMGIILTTIITAVNAACQAVMGAIKSAISVITSFLCLPLPGLGLHFQLPAFGQGHCNGVNILQAINMANQQARSAPPGSYMPWGFTPQ